MRFENCFFVWSTWFTIYLYSFPLTSSHICQHRSLYANKSPRKRGVPAAFLNFFLFSLNIPSILHHIFLIAFYWKIVDCWYKKQITPFLHSFDKYESDYFDMSLLRQINSFFQTLNLIWHLFSPVLFWNVSNLFTNE